MVRLKACHQIWTNENYRTFQFLMVRLKEVLDIDGGMFITISIPYGAIKSLSSDLD